MLPLLLVGLLAWVTPAQAAMDYAKQVLIGADFHDADFKGADLRLASLFGAKLQDADLSDTDLREATLDSAVFNGTRLDRAVLEDAFAFNTRFENVSIDGADFTNVPLRGDALNRLCAVATGTNPTTHRLTRDTLNCP